VLKGFWNREEFSGNELRGKVLGIIGFGRLGEMVADYANAFGMKVIAYDKRKIHNNAQFVTLDELLHKSDIISVHLSLSKTTKNFLDLEKVLELKKNPLLINTSRGEIIDENALVYALENNLISGAALDVLPGEVSTDIAWLKNSLLWQYANNNDNLLLTPHIGGVTMESVENTNLFIINKLKDYIKKVFS
jgi:D-3-phosphoglycerate dehydrogenase